jgi:protein-L-isoaspartate(D-aspartate) O-methyltransferase
MGPGAGARSRRGSARIFLALATSLTTVMTAACETDPPTEPRGGRSPAPASADLGAFAVEREAMVAQQIEARGVRDPAVLAAMRRVPRHRFVPPASRRYSYDDHPLPIGLGQTISQPYVVAFMTEALDLSGDEKVLEVGTGSGYQAAVLAELARAVFTIEILPELAERARDTLDELGYDVRVRAGDGYLGWPEEAPFDAILVAAAPDHVPPALVEQLAPGGRMILPVGDQSQELVLVRRTARGVERESVLPVRFVPMTGLAQD